MRIARSRTAILTILTFVELQGVCEEAVNQVHFPILVRNIEGYTSVSRLPTEAGLAKPIDPHSLLYLTPAQMSLDLGELESMEEVSCLQTAYYRNKLTSVPIQFHYFNVCVYICRFMLAYPNEWCQPVSIAYRMLGWATEVSAAWQVRCQ